MPAQYLLRHKVESQMNFKKYNQKSPYVGLFGVLS